MTQQPQPIISYRQSPELDPANQAPAQKAVNKVFVGIIWGVLGVVLAVWSVVGAVFWIPLMLRSILKFSLSHLQAVFVGKRPDGAARELRNAVSFYRRGFAVAIEVILKEEAEESNAQDPETGNLLLLELLWAIPVWYLILLGLGWIQASPVDIWNGFASIQWGEALGSIIDWFRV